MDPARVRYDAAPPALPLRGVPTDHGPADYTLHLDNHVVGIVEAKKLGVGPQEVLNQAERYARGLTNSPYNFGGFRAPFRYATNGEVIWFRVVRNPLSRSREVSGFHTPSALKEMLEGDFDGACETLLATPDEHEMMRPYQKAANAGVEKAIAERKRRMLVAMATGTGKTYTLVNQVYRLMKAGVARRVLFFVDRRALAAQAVRAFASFEAEPGKKFDKIYEVYSSRFQMGDFLGGGEVRSEGAAELVPDRPEAGARLRLRLHDPADGD